MSNDLERARALFLQAMAAQEANDPLTAEDCLRQALALAPERESILINLAALLAQRHATAEGQQLCERALAVNPNNPVAWMNLGLCQIGNDRPADAATSLQRALAIDAGNPAAYGNLGNALILLDRMDEAVAAFREAIRREPREAGWYASLGSALRAIQRYDEAIQAQRHALSIDPEHVAAHWNLSQLLLTMGDYANGWQEFEWRWRGEQAVQPRYSGKAPKWDGHSDLSGKRILLWAEQGLGDAIQFARFAPLLAARGAQLILQVPAALIGLMQTLGAPITVIAENSASLPAHDLHFPLLSLPRALGLQRDSIPAPVLKASPARIEAWQQRLGAARRPRVGIMWQGNLNNRAARYRSLPIAALAPILALPCDFYSLGKDVSSADRAWLASACSFECHADAITDFADTAALCRLMDQVVTIDTSVAHLAASIGCATHVLLARAADWRWGLPGQGQCSPWYPHSTKLFRQNADGDWNGAILALRTTLSDTLKL